VQCIKCERGQGIIYETWSARNASTFSPASPAYFVVALLLILDAYIEYMKSSASMQVVELRFLGVFFATVASTKYVCLFDFYLECSSLQRLPCTFM